MDINKEIEFFDNFESEHTDYDVLGERAYGRLLSMFARKLASRPGQKCIDLGCGSGAFTRRLEAFGLDLTGMDISPRLIERANAEWAGPRQRYLVGNIFDTGLPDKSFDIVVYSGVLHHLPTSADRVAVLKEGYRLLRPQGRLFAYDPYAWSPSMFLYRDPRSPLYSSVGKTDNEVLLSKAELRTELAEAGFRQVELVPIGGMTFCFVEGKVARLFLPLYNLYEVLLQYSGLERVFGTFLISSAVSEPS